MKKIIAASLAVVLLGTSTLSLADPPDWAGHQWNREHDGPYHHPDWRRDDWHRGDWRSYGPPPHMRIVENRYYYASPAPRYYRVHEDFRPGYRLPSQYYSDRYYVNNWYDYQLPPPPPQHRWTYIDGRYVLVAVATGIIAQILLAHR